MSNHPFDQAISLSPFEDLDPDELGQRRVRTRGRTSPAYANMIGPFGGVTAATFMHAVQSAPGAQGEPASISMTFISALADGEFDIVLTTPEPGRSVQFWNGFITQGDKVVGSGAVVMLKRRETWSDDETAPPEVPPAAEVQIAEPMDYPEWQKNYEMRFATGGFNLATMAKVDEPVHVWLRDRPGRALDFPALTSMADAAYPRPILRQGAFVPSSTLSIAINFLASAEEIRAVGDKPILLKMFAHRLHNSLADHSTTLWTEDGTILATSNQTMYYKDAK